MSSSYLFKSFILAKKMKKRKIGLALGSGGFRGLAHIGVLKVLEENDLRPDYLTGSSIGALIAAYYAIYGSASKIEEKLNEWPVDNLYKFLDLSWQGGFIAGRKFSKFLDKEFANFDFNKTFIPLKVVATDLASGSPFVFSKGLLTSAIRASISVPLMFKPFEYNDKFFVDGGLSNPVPVELLKDMGADLALGVNLYHKNEFVKRKFNMKNVALRSARIVMYNLAQADIPKADFMISPDTSEIIVNPSLSKYNLETVKKLIKIGEDATRKALPEIKKIFHKI